MFVRKKAAAALGASLIALSAVTAMPAEAAKVERDGGIWNRGIGRTTVWSHYKHNKKRHGSSVKGKRFVDSGCVAKKKVSRAETKRALWGNRTNYNFC